MDLASIAAFTAAGISILNVALTSRLTQKSERRQWHRDIERPLIAKYLTLSDKLTDSWSFVAIKEQSDRNTVAAGVKHSREWDEAATLYQQLGDIYSELQIVAEPALCEGIGMLHAAHHQMALALRPASDQERWPAFCEFMKTYQIFRRVAVMKSRKALLVRTADISDITDPTHRSFTRGGPYF